MKNLKYNKIELQFIPKTFRGRNGRLKLSFDDCSIDLHIYFGNELDRGCHRKGFTFKEAEIVHQIFENASLALLHSKSENQKIKTFALIKTTTLVDIKPESNWEEFADFCKFGKECVENMQRYYAKEKKLIEKYYSKDERRYPF